VEQGQPLSVAISAEPPLISEDSALLVRLGENSGRLEIVLRELSDSLEASARMSARFRSALAAPLFQGAASLGLLVLLSATVLPNMLELSRSVGTDLGPALSFLSAMIATALDPLVLFVEAQVLLALGFWVRRWGRTVSGRTKLDRWVLAVPVLRTLVLDRAAFRFCQSTGTLLGCGAPMLEALGSAASSAGNTVIRQEIQHAAKLVTDGETLAVALACATRLDRLLVSVVAVGEETGTLPKVLKSMRDVYQHQIEERLEKLLVLMEPFILALLGGVVALLSLLFFVPIMRVMQTL
jgi:type IV pilus assembly protein PilC